MMCKTLIFLILTLTHFNIYLFGQTDNLQVLQQSNCPKFKYDPATNSYSHKDKLVTGLFLCNDTLIIGNEQPIVIYKATLYEKGKITNLKQFHENGQLKSDLSYDTITNQIKLPYKYYDRNGNIEIEATKIDSSTRLLTFSKYSNITGKKIEEGKFLVDNNEIQFPISVNIDIQTQMPTSIISHSSAGQYKSNPEVEGFWIYFNEKNRFEINKMSLFVKNHENSKISDQFEVTLIEYFENYKVKKIIRENKLLDLQETMEFDAKGNLQSFIIIQGETLIFKK